MAHLTLHRYPIQVITFEFHEDLCLLSPKSRNISVTFSRFTSQFVYIPNLVVISSSFQSNTEMKYSPQAIVHIQK
jgi:hypothetical protein